ncbi:hypothetical protein QR680_016959 [Steinernema hermaphroditum]|uniref:Splicing factor 3B subunit 6 n=2 Tax=Steinernema TaxID=34507 RepID=A0AA39LNE4_9BILA|nr:hypothetical protein QR680_016959 [Steinernema hermaphroditum]
MTLNRIGKDSRRAREVLRRSRTEVTESDACGPETSLQKDKRNVLFTSIAEFFCVSFTFPKNHVKMAMAPRNRSGKLPPEVNRILYVKNLPYKITAEEMYDIFGKFGAVHQIRIGNTPETRGTAFVVYEDIFDAKNACEHLSGFNVSNRYLVVLYYQATKAYRKMDTEKARDKLEEIKERYGLGGDLEREKMNTPLRRN